MHEPGEHEILEHYYKKFEKNHKYHCFENKDKEACHALGDFYTKVLKREESANAFKLNCFENQYGMSCFEYCRLQTENRFSEPANFYKAAEIGCTGKEPDNRACVVLGQILEPPDGSDLVKFIPNRKQNVKRACELFEKACSENVMEGCLAALLHYSKIPDLPKVLEYAEKACERRSIKGCKIAASIHSAGSKEAGFKRDESKAKYYRDKAISFSPVKPIEMLYKNENK